MKVRVKCWYLAVALIVLVSVSSGQQPAPTKNNKFSPEVSKQDFTKNSFESLLRERDSLTTELDATNLEIGFVKDAISKRDDMKRAEALHKPTAEFEKGISDSLGYAHISGAAFNDLDKQLDLKQSLSQEKLQRKSLIDAELAHRADVVGPQQDFKLKMSYIFAALVGVVILGFFAVAFTDEQAQREIFSGQAGIQFVTLFSLVIAIILFGIIDVLEGKELAALLGGLSGYILGRSTSTANERVQSTLKPAAPVISGINPTSGAAGESVVITGTNSAQPTGVAFGGAKASNFAADSDTQVTATVPTGAKTGRLAVTTSGGTAQSVTNFTVT